MCVCLKVFFKEWKKVYQARQGIIKGKDKWEVGIQRTPPVGSLEIKEEKQRAFGRTGALINELNAVSHRIHARCLKMATQDSETQHLLKWFDMSGIGDDDCHTLRYALRLEDETWTPVQKLRRVINDTRALLVNGRPGLFYHIPHDAMLAI